MIKTLLLTSLVLGLTVATVIPHPGSIVSHAPLTYKVSLDDTPEERWAQIVKDFEIPLKDFMYWVDLLPIPATFFDGVQWYAKNVFKHQDFVAEVDALAKLSGYPFEKIFFLNFMYEFSTFNACTAILIRNSAGKILHGRNLDFEMFTILSRLIVNVEYYRGDKKVFSIDTVVGSVFALTGIRHGAFAVNVDTRKEKNIYEDFISILIDDAIPTCWLVRKVLEEEIDYAGASKRLRFERVGGPVYFIVSGLGNNEGMVIEKDTGSVHAYYELSEDTWFLVQTNYDREYPDPLHDPRRVPAEHRLEERGNIDLNEQALLEGFMMVWPTFNIATIMTAIMVPSTGYHNTTVWYAENPTPAPSVFSV